MLIKLVISLFVCSVFISISYCQDTISQHSKTNTVDSGSIGVNPYPEAPNQRRSATLLTISGAAELALGIAFSSNVDAERLFSNKNLANSARNCDNMFLLGGIFQSAVALPVLIAAEVERSKHDRWERNHGKPRISFNGSSIAVNF